MVTSSKSVQDAARRVFRLLPLFGLLIPVLGMIAAPAVHVVTYRSGFEVIAKNHFTFASTLMSLKEVVARANDPSTTNDGNLQRLVQELERQALIRKARSRLDDLVMLGVVRGPLADALQESQRAQYECAVKEWC